MTAKERFDTLDSKRNGVLERARDCADLTIPALMPPQGHTEDSDLTTPNQSLGARGLNNLASKLRLSLFPPGNPFYRFELEEEVEEAIKAGDAQAQVAIDSGVRKLENASMKLLEGENHGATLHGLLKQVATTGDSLLHIPDSGGSRYFKLTDYVIQRDTMGVWFEIVIKETVAPQTLDPKVREAARIEIPPEGQPASEDIDVFTHVKREGNSVSWYQEINDVVVEGTQGRVADALDSPYIPVRWSGLRGEHYGRGHVEEYLGDLRSLDELTQSLNEFSRAAAKVVFLDRPNSTTDIEAIQNARSGEFVEGNIEDIGVLQVNKFSDFQVTKAQVEDLTLRLSHAFLLQSGTVRNAERVTLGEIQAMAQELEDVLGGVYTVLTRELQLPVVRRLMVQLKKAGRFPKLPKGALNPVIVTGFEALGRGHELNRMRAYFADGAAMFGESFISQFHPGRGAAALATHHNVDIEGLLKSQEESNAERAQQQAAQIADKAAGPVAGAVAQAATQNQT